MNSLYFVDYSQLHKEQFVARSTHWHIYQRSSISLPTVLLHGSLALHFNLQFALWKMPACVDSYRVRSPKPLSSSVDRSHQSTGHMRRSAQTRTKKGLLCKFPSAKYIYRYGHQLIWDLGWRNYATAPLFFKHIEVRTRKDWDKTSDYRIDDRGVVSSECWKDWRGRRPS